MVYLNLSGNLGNQLFKYAFARMIALETNQGISIRYGEKSYPQSLLALQSFNIACEEIGIKRIPDAIKYGSVLQRIAFIFKYFFARFSFMQDSRFVYSLEQRDYKLFFKLGVYCHGRGYVPVIIRKHKNYFVNTLGESFRYYSKMNEILKEEFTPTLPPVDKNQFIYEKAKQRNSVCVSIRAEFIKGDWGDNRRVCTREYYKKAIEGMSEKLDNPVFIVFSEDPEWVKTNLNIENAVFEDGSDPVWEKLRMMYSCNHFILSNSTFSWWAQYLSRNVDNKIVISPFKWFTNDYWTDFNEPSWITIDSVGQIMSIEK